MLQQAAVYNVVAAATSKLKRRVVPGKSTDARGAAVKGKRSLLPVMVKPVMSSPTLQA